MLKLSFSVTDMCGQSKLAFSTENIIQGANWSTRH